MLRSVGFAPEVSDGVNGSANDVHCLVGLYHTTINQYLVGIRIPFPNLAVQMVVLGLEENTAVILRRSLIQALSMLTAILFVDTARRGS